MKGKAAITNGVPDAVMSYFGSEIFAEQFLHDIVRGVFGVEKPFSRPAEFYVQMPDTTVRVGNHLGVEFRLTGISRGQREPKLFHDALEALEDLVVDTVRQALQEAEASTVQIQVFVVIMIDGDVPGPPESGTYGSILETKPVWVTASTIIKE